VATVALKRLLWCRERLYFYTTIFALVILITFLRWVERISRLGRMGHTIKLVEDATANAIKNRLASPTLNGIVINPNQEKGTVYGEFTGYVQQIYLSKLQEIAEKLDALITINAIPGSFSAIDQPLFIYRYKKAQPQSRITMI
jgi:uncharacterized membrane protein